MCVADKLVSISGLAPFPRIVDGKEWELRATMSGMTQTLDPASTKYGDSLPERCAFAIRRGDGLQWARQPADESDPNIFWINNGMQPLDAHRGDIVPFDIRAGRRVVRDRAAERVAHPSRDLPAPSGCRRNRHSHPPFINTLSSPACC